MLADDEIVFTRGSFVSVFRFRGYFLGKDRSLEYILVIGELCELVSDAI